MPMYPQHTGKSWDEILEGKLSWHNFVSPDENGKWSLKLYLNPESLDKVNKLKEEGLLNVLKKDEEGYSMVFHRHANKTIKGKVVAYTAPIVLDKEGKPHTGIGIGHGSDIKVKLQVYRFNRQGLGGGKAVAARLEAVRIINLIPYESHRDLDIKQTRQIKGLGGEVEVAEDLF